MACAPRFVDLDPIIEDSKPRVVVDLHPINENPEPERSQDILSSFAVPLKDKHGMCSRSRSRSPHQVKSALASDRALPRPGVPDYRNGQEFRDWEDTFSCHTCNETPNGRTYVWTEQIVVALDAHAPNPSEYAKVYALPCRGCGKQLVWDGDLLQWP